MAGSVVSNHFVFSLILRFLNAYTKGLFQMGSRVKKMIELRVNLGVIKVSNAIVRDKVGFRLGPEMVN